jgi:hypothetical protein
MGLCKKSTRVTDGLKKHFNTDFCELLTGFTKVIEER